MFILFVLKDFFFVYCSYVSQSDDNLWIWINVLTILNWLWQWVSIVLTWFACEFFLRQILFNAKIWQWCKDLLTIWKLLFMTIMQRRLQNDEAKMTMLTDIKCNEVAYLPIFIAAIFSIILIWRYSIFYCNFDKQWQ